jgi:hypothetical protein
MEAVTAAFGDEGCLAAAKAAAEPQYLTYSWPVKEGKHGVYITRSLPLQIDQILVASPAVQGLVSGLLTYHAIYAIPNKVARTEVRFVYPFLLFLLCLQVQICMQLSKTFTVPQIRQIPEHMP